MNRNKRLKDMTLEDEPFRSEGVQHATEEEATHMTLTQLREAVEDRRAWRALVHGVMKSRTRLID